MSIKKPNKMKKTISIRIDEDAHSLLLFAKATLNKKLGENKKQLSYSKVIRYLVQRNMDELIKYAKEMGISIPKEVKLSEL